MSSTTPTPVNAGIGANIRTLRQAADLTCADLGAAIGMHPDVLRNIEVGARPLRFTEALDLARVLGIPVTALAEATAAQIASRSSVTIAVTATQRDLTQQAVRQAARVLADAQRLQALIADLAPAAAPQQQHRAAA